MCFHSVVSVWCVPLFEDDFFLVFLINWDVHLTNERRRIGKGRENMKERMGEEKRGKGKEREIRIKDKRNGGGHNC